MALTVVPKSNRWQRHQRRVVVLPSVMSPVCVWGSHSDNAAWWRRERRLARADRRPCSERNTAATSALNGLNHRERFTGRGDSLPLQGSSERTPRRLFHLMKKSTCARTHKHTCPQAHTHTHTHTHSHALTSNHAFYFVCFSFFSSLFLSFFLFLTFFHFFPSSWVVYS